MWSMIRFALHQLRSRDDPQDAAEQEQRIVLTIPAPPEVIAWQSATIVHYWRRPSLTRLTLLKRAAPVIIVAFVHFAGWNAAGVLSSKVYQAMDDQLLVLSHDCGFYIDLSTINNTFIPASGFQSRTLNSTRIADNYVQECYNVSKSSNTLCRKFVQQEIKWAFNANATCPFASGMCLGGGTGAYEMNTGPLNSHTVFGMNARWKDRVDYARKTTCAPLVTGGAYGKLIPGTNPNFPGEEFALYFYGNFTPTVNYTYMISTYAQRGDTGYLLT